MNKNKIIKFLFIILVAFMMLLNFNPNVYAKFQTQLADSGRGTSSEPSVNSKGNPTNLDIFQPSVPNSPKANDILGTILGWLQVIGIFIGVISIAIIGFNLIIGSAGEKAEMQSKMGGVFIGAVLVTTGVTIAKFIINSSAL